MVYCYNCAVLPTAQHIRPNVIGAEPFCCAARISGERCLMKKMLLGIVLLASATMSGQTPFDGTWMTKLDTAKLPTKPDKYSLSNNMYECLTCVPKYSVKADGSDHKVTGHPYYDTVAVHVANASSIEIIQKKDGKVMATDTQTVSSDGNTLSDKFTDNSGTQPVTGEATSKRVSSGAAGSHAVSG